MTFPAIYLSYPKAFSRFQRIAAVLERFVAACPASLDADNAARKLGIPVMEVTSICRALEGTGLLVPATEFQSWNLGKPKGAVTLEDVWNAVGSVQHAEHLPHEVAQESATDLLVAQAFIEMQQSISQLLRQFQLHRVSTSAQGCNTHRIRTRRSMAFRESLEEA